MLFHLALTYGLETDPVTAMEHAVGLVEDVGREHGVEHPIQMTVATTDGTRIWAFRYSSEGNSRTLFYSTKLDTLQLMYPDSPAMHEALDAIGEHGRLIVSEPLGDELPGAWNAVPERSWGVLNPGAEQDDLRSFNPVVPARRAPALV